MGAANRSRFCKSVGIFRMLLLAALVRTATRLAPGRPSDFVDAFSNQLRQTRL